MKENADLLIRLLQNLLSIPCSPCPADQIIPDRSIHFLQDALGLCTARFCYQKTIIILGPFAPRPWEEEAQRALLSSQKLSDSCFLTYKQRYCQYRILPPEELTRTVQSILSALHPDAAPYQMVPLTCSNLTAEAALLPEDLTDQETTIMRYQYENQLLQHVRQGDSEGALKALRQLHRLSSSLRFALLSDRGIAGAGSIRTLVRKAAETAGVHPVIVDAISQFYAQKSYTIHSGDKLMLLNDRMIREFCSAVKEARQESFPPNIRKVATYIRLHLGSPISLTTLAELAETTPNYLSHAFKNATGMSITQYIAHARCTKAAGLLRTTTLPVQEISHYVGYPDNNYFVKVFKEYSHMTPTQYRMHQSELL